MPIIPDPPEGPGGFAGSGDEIDVQRHHTLAFIDTQPVVVQLIPRSRVKQPTGGYAYVDQVPRDSQTMRLIEPTGPPTLLLASDGVQRELAMILLGRWDVQIEKYDRFTLLGKAYEVASLYFPNGWEQRAEVIRLG